MKETVYAILRFLRNSLLIELGTLVVVVASFLFTGGFSPQALSDRMLWAGIFAILGGGAVGIFGGMSTGPGVSLPLPHLAGQQEVLRQEASRRYNFALQHKLAFYLWTLGLLSVAASALIGIFLASGN